MSGYTEPRTLLVTGATGFVGACLCRYFAAIGERVLAVRGSSQRQWRLPSESAALQSIESVQVDLTSAEAVRKLFREVRPVAVLNCAAFGAYPSQVDRDKIYRVNFDAVRNLVAASGEVPGFRAFLQAGSSSEYGWNCTAPDEGSATKPDSEYAVSKVAATTYLQYMAAKHRFPAWVLRLYSVYGPFEEASRLIPRLLKHAALKEYPPLVNPSVSRDFVFIDDVCAAFERVLERAAALPPGEVFNVGTGVRTTLAELVGHVRALHAIEREPTWGTMANRQWDHSDWYSNPQKASEWLDWRSTTSLAEGLARTVRWRTENTELARIAEANVVTGA